MSVTPTRLVEERGRRRQLRAELLRRMSETVNLGAPNVETMQASNDWLRTLALAYQVVSDD